jgi:hypothetical protein
MGPDFICIGAPRSGTTWLHRMLSKHPQLWMTPIKELHYFDDPSRSRYFKDLKKRWKNSRLMTKWDLRYFSGIPSDKWYASLFADAQRQGMIAGEITPDYAILGKEVFLRIRALNPHTKLIFMMRDPIERSWSHFNNERRKGKVQLLGDPVVDAIHFCSLPDNLHFSSYIETIDVIESCFPRNQIFYGFFDDLESRNEWFAKNVLEFLGVDSSDLVSYIPSGAVNAVVAGGEIPEEFKIAMAPKLLPSLERLANRFESYPIIWRERVQQLI